MDKITSFTIDHLKLLPGVYVSRKDRVGDQVITTFDIRMTRPNYEPVMNTAEVHTIEHLAATCLRWNWSRETGLSGIKDKNSRRYALKHKTPRCCSILGVLFYYFLFFLFSCIRSRCMSR